MKFYTIQSTEDDIELYQWTAIHWIIKDNLDNSGRKIERLCEYPPLFKTKKEALAFIDLLEKNSENAAEQDIDGCYYRVGWRADGYNLEVVELEVQEDARKND